MIDAVSDMGETTWHDKALAPSAGNTSLANLRRRVGKRERRDKGLSACVNSVIWLLQLKASITDRLRGESILAAELPSPRIMETYY